MGEKDMTEKTLEAYNDVFADIVNGLLFQGRELVKEDELEQETARSIYKIDGYLHEQERDVAKYWKKCDVRIALYGLENQTDIDVDMPFRVIGYDGAAYRAQLLQDRKERYPVVTLVLYFGEEHWDKPLSLLEGMCIPEEMRPYVNDYHVNLFEIAWLTPEQVKNFHSDFRIVADYFVQKRMSRDYVPTRDTIRHVNEVLQLMAALTKDHRFEDFPEEVQKGEITNMCDVLDRAEERGYGRGYGSGYGNGMQQGILQGMQQGMQQGLQQGIQQEKYNNARAMLREGLSLEMVSRCIGLPVAELKELNLPKQ